jgi:hypothetical protein
MELRNETLVVFDIIFDTIHIHWDSYVFFCYWKTNKDLVDMNKD